MRIQALIVDEQLETLYIYVVLEEAPKPQFFPIVLSVLALLVLVVLAIAVPYQQPVTRVTLRVPAILLPLKTFTATTAIIPTGIKVYLATTALRHSERLLTAQLLHESFRMVGRYRTSRHTHTYPYYACVHNQNKYMACPDLTMVRTYKIDSMVWADCCRVFEQLEAVQSTIERYIHD